MTRLSPDSLALRRSSRSSLVRGLVVMLVALVPVHAHAQRSETGDFAPSSSRWNGLRALLDVAESESINLDTPARVDLDELEPDTALLILHPAERLPVEALTTFVQGGGRLAIADDFGAGDQFLAVFGMRRGATTSRPPALRGNPELLVAAPRPGHPLATGVSGLISNHPQALLHDELRPVFAFSDDEALVLTGAVERGRLVAIGDPSVLINNMLEFRGNRRFAENLLHYLATDEGRRVILATPETEIVGRRGDASDRINDLRDLLRAASTQPMPPMALTIGSLLLLALSLTFALSSMPLRSPYRAIHLHPPVPIPGGFVGRVAFFERHRPRLAHAAATYLFELEEALAKVLSRPVSEVRATLESDPELGLRASERAELLGLLAELEQIRNQLDNPPGPPKVSTQKLERMVTLGERLLGKIDV